MSSFGTVAVLSGLILAILLARAIYVLRKERDDPRGSLPGTGDHIVDASYLSGGGGGGQHGSFRVPRDPQAYARAFVPKDKGDKT